MHNGGLIQSTKSVPMKTVDKALRVLDQFSLHKTEIGLNELSRMAELDKAATRRLLVALGKHGFIEQSQTTRQYRLGPGFLRLARIREATVPIAEAARDVARHTVQVVDETVHISVPSGNALSVIAYALPDRGNIINIIPSDPLPFNATSSGIAYLSFLPADAQREILAQDFPKSTSYTVTEAHQLQALIAQTRENGFASCRNTFEVGVSSVAMPFFLEERDPAGTVAIAVPDSNFSDARQAELADVLLSSTIMLEEALTGSSRTRERSPV